MFKIKKDKLNVKIKLLIKPVNPVKPINFKLIILGLNN